MLCFNTTTPVSSFCVIVRLNDEDVIFLTNRYVLLCFHNVLFTWCCIFTMSNCLMLFHTNDVSLSLCLHEDYRNEDNTGLQHAAACLLDPGGEWPWPGRVKVILRTGDINGPFERETEFERVNTRLLNCWFISFFVQAIWHLSCFVLLSFLTSLSFLTKREMNKGQFRNGCVSGSNHFEF